MWEAEEGGWVRQEWGEREGLAVSTACEGMAVAEGTEKLECGPPVGRPRPTGTFEGSGVSFCVLMGWVGGDWGN